MQERKWSHRHRNLLLAGFGCAGLVLVVYILAGLGLGIPCLFHKITGYLCPGCGNTRAALALLRLDLGAALSYNLLFPLEFLYIGWILFHCSRSYLRGKSFSYRPPCVWVDGIMLALVLIWWVVRNIEFTPKA